MSRGRYKIDELNISEFYTVNICTISTINYINKGIEILFITQQSFISMVMVSPPNVEDLDEKYLKL